MGRVIPIDRRGTDCFKWDLQDTEFSDSSMKEAARDAIPMWIADMDFKAPQEVEQALLSVAEHGAYGYTGRTESFFAAIGEWLQKRHNWSVERQWLDFSPGVLPGISGCVHAFTQPGDKIIIQPPVYYPFFNIVRNNGRQLLENKFVCSGTHFEMDFEDLEKKAADPQTKMMILCSPHNPVGRVWTRGELEKVSEICRRHHVMVVADEIHSDLIVGATKHTPFGQAAGGCQYVSFYAPSKTFNLAGLQTSACVIPDETMHEAYKAALRRNYTYSATRFGIEAFKAAYRHGEAYLEELLSILRENYAYLKDYLEKNLPEVVLFPLEGTYLAWMDFRRCGLPLNAMNEFFIKQAKVMFDYGAVFSEDYEGFARMNIACPMETIRAALEQLHHAVRAAQADLNKQSKEEINK